ncbi:ABC transporter permease [Nocardioides antri]|uniref:ABC transporter permease n=1 Tax=Nocardioides antri TaxID=2607659 RepID=A0A5B1M7F3_9ACTN|nr:ABC transporter permease [Nocardioides antri]KAA1427797.1 ABC transporter permease [Nocardioides antri]
MTTTQTPGRVSEARAPEARRGRQWPRPSATWLLAAPLAVVAIFFAYPLLKMFQASFTDFVVQPHGTWDNYTWFLGDAVQRTIVIRTVMVTLLVTALCLVLAYPYAYLMTIVGPRVRLLMVAAIMLPFWTSLLVRLYAWVIVLQPNGPMNSALERLGLGRVDLLGTMWGVALGSVHVLLPFMVLPLYASLGSIDRRLVDAAVSLGARPSVAFARVYFPLSVPGVLAGSTIVFIFTMGFYFTPAFLGSSRNSLISEQIVNQISRLLAFGRGGAMALLLLLLTLLLLGLAAWLSRPVMRALGQGGR